MRATVYFSTCLALASLDGILVADAFSVNKAATLSRPTARIGKSSLEKTEILTSSPLSMRLQAASTTPEEEETGLLSNLGFEPIFAALYVIFLGYGLFFSPGEVFSDVDKGLIEAYAQNPTSPGWNELFLAVFNLLGAMPFVISQLIFPQGSKKGLPATPFCVGSMFMGYGALGSYLTFRSPSVDSKSRSEMGWVSKNILENKIFSWLVVALSLSCYAASGVIGLDPSALLQGFGEMAADSKLVSVSTADLSVLTIAAAVLIRKDFQLRNPESDDSKAILIAAASMLLPISGAALYCALREPLPEE